MLVVLTPFLADDDSPLVLTSPSLAHSDVTCFFRGIWVEMVPLMTEKKWKIRIKLLKFLTSLCFGKPTIKQYTHVCLPWCAFIRSISRVDCGTFAVLKSCIRVLHSSIDL